MPLANGKVIRMVSVLEALLTFVVRLGTIRTLREISILDFAIQSKEHNKI